MCIAAIQLASGKSVQTNLHSAIGFITEAAQQGAKVAVLPEEFATLGLTAQEKQGVAERFGEGPLQTALAKAAGLHDIWVVGGTLPLLAENGIKFTNSTLVWNSQGHCVGRYDKVHLFDVRVGQEQYAESQTVVAGNKIVIIDSPVGKLGLVICYDVRFPELFRVMALEGCEIFVLPCAFTVPTGQAHWEILLKARAVENLCYMVAPAQIGERADGKKTYGHSMIVGPWGDTKAALTDQQGVIFASIDLEKLRRLREQFPVLQHMRTFILKQLAQHRGK